jgi:hypothetical protein
VAVLSMSKQEFSRLDLPLRVQSGCLRISHACVLIGLRWRRVFRLLRGLKQEGPARAKGAREPTFQVSRQTQ